MKHGKVKVIKSAKGIEVLERVRQICGSWPEVEEVIDGFG